MTKTIVFTSEFGSGARLIAKRLSDSLAIPFYGEDSLLKLAAERSGISASDIQEFEESLAKYEGKPLNLKEISPSVNITLGEEIFKAYEGTVLELASKGPCILMEKESHPILKPRMDILSVFVYGSGLEKKIMRCTTILGITREDAVALIIEQEKQRLVFHQAVSDIEKYNMKEYDLCINSDIFEEETSERIILAALNSEPKK